MDPNAALKEIRELVKRILSDDPEDQQELLEASIDAARLAELIQSLDKWLSGVGFYPVAWQGQMLSAINNIKEQTKGVTRS